MAGIIEKMKWGAPMRQQLCGAKNAQKLSLPWAHRKWCRRGSGLTHGDRCANTRHIHLAHTRSHLHSFHIQVDETHVPILQSAHVRPGWHSNSATCACAADWPGGGGSTQLKPTHSVNTSVSNPDYLLTWTVRALTLPRTQIVVSNACFGWTILEKICMRPATTLSGPVIKNNKKCMLFIYLFRPAKNIFFFKLPVNIQDTFSMKTGAKWGKTQNATPHPKIWKKKN